MCILNFSLFFFFLILGILIRGIFIMKCVEGLEQVRYYYIGEAFGSLL